jgi:hypothetical protein
VCLKEVHELVLNKVNVTIMHGAKVKMVCWRWFSAATELADPGSHPTAAPAAA